MKLTTRLLVLCLPMAGAAGAQTLAPPAGTSSPAPARASADAGAAGYASAEAAYQAAARGDHAAAVRAAREAVRLSPNHGSYRLLLVNMLAEAGEQAQAEQAASQWLAQQPRDAEVLAARSRVRARLGQTAASAQDAQAALGAGGLSAQSEIDLLWSLDRKDEARRRLTTALAKGELAGQRDVDVGYLALRVGDDAAALAAFQRADARHALPERARLDAAYAASRLGRNDEAIAYFRQALAAADAGRLDLTPQQRYDVSRAVADRTRTWGSFASLAYRGLVPSRLAALSPGARDDSLQGSVEAYWRPWGYRDGSYVELYGGVLETLYSKSNFATGGPSAQASLGVRAKPLTWANLVLALERRVAIGSQATSDWLGRIGYSYSLGTDLRVDVPSWTTGQLYAEVGRYKDQRLTYGTAEAQLGRSFRLDALDARTVLFPHVVLGADYYSRVFGGQQQGASGAGLGVGLRHWFNAAPDSAPRSYLDLSLQYRAHLSGDERGKGVFLRTTLAY